MHLIEPHELERIKEEAMNEKVTLGKVAHLILQGSTKIWSLINMDGNVYGVPANSRDWTFDHIQTIQEHLLADDDLDGNTDVEHQAAKTRMRLMTAIAKRSGESMQLSARQFFVRLSSMREEQGVEDEGILSNIAEHFAAEAGLQAVTKNDLSPDEEGLTVDENERRERILHEIIIHVRDEILKGN